jgi:REP element-mobilizing transposase RayT
MATTALTKELYFTTSTVIDWLDVFTRPLYKHIIIESLSYCQKQKGLDIYAWVLMTNHLHMIAGTRLPGITLGDILRDFKKYTNKKILAAIESNQQESRRKWLLDRCWFAGNNDSRIKNYRFWQEGNHVEQLYSYDFYKQKLNYIHNNPVRQEIVERPEDYLYSSARNYAGMEGLLDVIVAP